ncbi:hypothetical protein Tsubulata_044557 [Turnera subulata]|uniref:Uncharacterized protein n=1 Tax=Turnera subulata TaxID=218843 RepID=A0A9Q0F7J7_9ROSI|nr:hypothetical protein Tsubulata_044557 [Turnera subulata]
MISFDWCKSLNFRMGKVDPCIVFPVIELGFCRFVIMPKLMSFSVLNVSRILLRNLSWSMFRIHDKSSGCLGCYSKPKLVNSLDDRSKEINGPSETAKKPSLSEDFWTTSACDMDNSAAQSQGSLSSLSTVNQTLDPHSGSGSANNPSEFVNHGKFLLSL